MPRIDILVANNLPLYREVLASTLRVKRPDLAILSVSHLDLDTEVARFRPRMVICSEVSQTVAELCPSWILLFPDHRDEAIVEIGGQARVLPHAGISALLSLLNDVYVSEEIFTQMGDET